MSRIRVLIVEDEPVIAEHIALYLQNEDFEVSGLAYDFEEALRELQENTPDVALLDINIDSEADGIDLAAQINARWQIPFLFLTSYADKLTLERAKKVTPGGYIVKPFNEHTLQASLVIAVSNFVRERNRDTGPLRPDRINRGLLSPLSDRELEVAQLLYEGVTNSEMAARLFLSLNTVKTHLKNIYLKLDVGSRLQAVNRLRQQMLS